MYLSSTGVTTGQPGICNADEIGVELSCVVPPLPESLQVEIGMKGIPYDIIMDDAPGPGSEVELSASPNPKPERLLELTYVEESGSHITVMVSNI